MIDHRVNTELLLALLDGATDVNAMRRNGKPCRVVLPDDRDGCTAIVRAHLNGEPAMLTFRANGRDPWRERVDAVVLAALCPGADGRCRWIAIDLDAADHGDGGLADPVRAARVLAERADAAGLATGLLVARSRGGRGRHMFLILPAPVPLADAVLGVGALAATAFRIAASDVAECGARHAFRRVDGACARPGDAGAVELLPRSNVKPPHGWAIALPAAREYAAHDGGVIVDPFSDRPIQHQFVPRCDNVAWATFIKEARAALALRSATDVAPVSPRTKYTGTPHPIDRIAARTRTFLAGDAPEGTRNLSAFAASANLLGCGIEEREAEGLILAGASACGLPEREARAAFSSATGVIARKRRGK